jgi:RNA polymerase sigma-70 factor (ECF subfamily)
MVQKKKVYSVRRPAGCERLFPQEPGERRMERSDAELMQRWQQGDGRAFEALVERWQQSVARLLGRLARPGQVPDLCQEVFLRLYQAGPRYREVGAFSTWLYRIVLNVARDAGRRQRREPARSYPALAELDARVAVNGQVPDKAACQKECVRVVADALEELPPPLREVVALRHYEGLSFEEIARLTGTPASTLKSRFTAALGRLRVRLQERGWGPGETTS